MPRILGVDGLPYQRTDKRIRRQEGGLVTGAGEGALDPTVAWLKEEIDTFERENEKFIKRGRKIQKKYKDTRSPREDTQTRYNILWANIQTRLPALFARTPKPVVERRFKDKDPIGRTAAEILERSISYTLDHVNDSYYLMRQAVLDYELPGLGCMWANYEPHFHKPELPAAEDEGSPPENDQGEKLEAEGEGITDDAPDAAAEKLKYEECILDYVNWEDIGWSWARIWGENRLLWRIAYMGRAQLSKRFTDLSEEEIRQIPLEWSPKNLKDSKIKLARKKAIVYEVWDKEERCRYWLVKNYAKLLDERPDALGLHNFFPAARPLMANALSDEFAATPNYTFYQDQANEIDELSTRIAEITKALKVAGVYDSSAKGLDRLLSEGVENKLIPISDWAARKEKGGLAGMFELLPLKEIAEALSELREQRQQVIEDVYQITGIADIVRGMSDPQETATAQQMKGKFSMIRLEDQQREVQRFARDMVQITGEIVAGFSIETLKQISGVKLLTNQEKAQLQQQLAVQQQQAAAAQAAKQAQAQHPPGAPPPGPAAAAPPAVAGPVPGVDPKAHALQLLQQAVEHFKRPRRVVRDHSGRITELA